MLASPMNARVDQIRTAWTHGEDSTHSDEVSASGTKRTNSRTPLNVR